MRQQCFIVRTPFFLVVTGTVRTQNKRVYELGYIIQVYDNNTVLKHSETYSKQNKLTGAKARPTGAID